jgi:lysophospholipase L1-like esterase
MNAIRRPKLVLLAAATAAIVSVLLAPGAGAASSSGAPRFDPPKKYYLALGDSYTYGFQFRKLGRPPAAFDTGYVDAFAERMRALRPELVVVNYGCPGESSGTFLAGGCPTRPLVALHDPYDGPQLEAAVAFLRAHPGKVSPITVTLWGNDVGDLIRSCGCDFFCVQARAPAAIAAYETRLSTIMRTLRAAAPASELIVNGAWHSVVDVDISPFFDVQFAALNAAIARQAAVVGARFADLATVFNPPGAQARQTAICTLTLLCLEGDSHPSDAGYRAIAGALFAASGYDRLDG